MLISYHCFVFFLLIFDPGEKRCYPLSLIEEPNIHIILMHLSPFEIHLLNKY